MDRNGIQAEQLLSKMSCSRRRCPARGQNKPDLSIEDANDLGQGGQGRVPAVAMANRILLEHGAMLLDTQEATASRFQALRRKAAPV